MDTAAQQKVDLTPIWITLYFDPAMQMVVGKPVMRSMVSKGCPFWFVLRNLLSDYPEIWRRHPPGTLGFTLNGVAPALETLLADGDRIAFFVNQHAKSLPS